LDSWETRLSVSTNTDFVATRQHASAERHRCRCCVRPRSCGYGHRIGKNPRPASVTGLLLVLALLGAACTADEALTKDEYIAQGNAICEDANARFEAISSEFYADLPEDSTPEEFVEVFSEFIDQVTAVSEDQLAELRDLAAPEGDEELLAGLYNDLEAVLGALNDLANAAAAGDPAAIDQLASREDPGHGGLRIASTAFDEVDNQAIEYGLTACAS